MIETSHSYHYLCPARMIHSGPEYVTRLQDAARGIEGSFLAEFLNAVGSGRTVAGFDGGIGEDQFGSLLVRAKAEQIAQQGGIGLATLILRATLSNVMSERTAPR